MFMKEMNSMTGMGAIPGMGGGVGLVGGSLAGVGVKLA